MYAKYMDSPHLGFGREAEYVSQNGEWPSCLLAYFLHTEALSIPHLHLTYVEIGLYGPFNKYIHLHTVRVQSSEFRVY